jgi:hypothetical protein
MAATEIDANNAAVAAPRLVLIFISFQHWPRLPGGSRLERSLALLHRRA